MLFRRIISGAIAALTAITVSAHSRITADAEENPMPQVDLSIGTVEIYLDEIEKGTTIEVPVSIKNNPGFVSLYMSVEYKRDQKYRYKKLNVYGNNVAGVNIFWNNNDIDEPVRRFDVEAENDKVVGDIALFSIVFELSDDIEPGTYPVWFSESDQFSIRTENKEQAYFSKEAFRTLTPGAIIVKESRNQTPPDTPKSSTTTTTTTTTTTSKKTAPTETTKTTTASSTTTTVPTASAPDETTTTETSAQTETEAPATTTVPVTSASETVTSAEPTASQASEETKDEKDEKDPKHTFYLAAAIGSAAALALIFIVLIIKRRRDREYDD